MNRLKILVEFPHAEYMPNKYVDFKAELYKKGKWLYTLVSLFNSNKGKEKAITLNLTGDKFFMAELKRTWKALSDKSQDDIMRKLPMDFLVGAKLI